MSDQSKTTIRKVILSASEQKALAWLLSATDNGRIISGSLLPNVILLHGIAKRLGRSAENAN